MSDASDIRTGDGRRALSAELAPTAELALRVRQDGDRLSAELWQTDEGSRLPRLVWQHHTNMSVHPTSLPSHLALTLEHTAAWLANNGFPGLRF